MKQKEISEKRKQKKDAIITSLEYKKQQLISSVKFQYEILTKNQTDKVQKLYDKKLERRLRKINRIYKERQTNLIKQKVYHKVVVKKENIRKIKQEAFKQVQKYAKLSRLLEWWMLLQVDTWNIVPLKKCQWWHIYWKKNFPHMAFKELNIRPISSRCNKAQGDMVAWWIEKTWMTKKQIKRLKNLSEDREAKNRVLCWDFYREQYAKYKKLNDKIEQRLLDNQKVSGNEILVCTNEVNLV